MHRKSFWVYTFVLTGGLLIGSLIGQLLARFLPAGVARDFFTRVTSLYKNLNYSPTGSPGACRYRAEIEALAGRHSREFLPQGVEDGPPRSA